jgi:hypothetical protein
MRTLMTLGLVCFGISPAFADDLCRRDEKKVLFAIDQICGDTWCEGDSNFQFRKIRCNFKLGSCALEFRTAPWKNSDDEEYDWSKSKTCVLRNVESLDSLIDTNRQVPVLRDGPYEQITTCIDHLNSR